MLTLFDGIVINWFPWVVVLSKFSVIFVSCKQHMSVLYLSMSLDKASCFVWFVNPLTLVVATEKVFLVASWFNSDWIKYLQLSGPAKWISKWGPMEHWKVLSATMISRQEKFSNSRHSRIAKTIIFWPWWQPLNSFCFETLFLPLSQNTNTQKYFCTKFASRKKYKQKSRLFSTLWRTEKTMTILYTLEVSDWIFLRERKLHYNIQQI